MSDFQQRYVIKEKLGEGAMGEVFLANDTLLNRPVALKYLITSQDAAYNETFLTEARMLASLNHPNITAIYDAMFDEKENSYCLVMEYVEGKSLSYVVDNWSGPLPLDMALDFSISILQALQYAHDRGIVHRDIKPDNVLVQKEIVKLTDFGVAGLISLLAEGTDFMTGTPAYMAPEQIKGNPTDGRADLYALGIMLFEMLSGGEIPYTFGDLDDLLDAHVEQAPLPLRNFAPDAPLALERVILQLLAKNPNDRYLSANAVVEALSAIQARQKFSQSYLDLLTPDTKPLVGRSEPLEQLKTIWTDAQQAAQPRLLIIQGDMGIGKTKLVTEFLGKHVIDACFAGLVGRCDESGAPYAPYADILTTIIDKQLTHSPVTQEQTDHLLEQIPGLTRLLNVSSTTENKTVRDEEKRTSSSSGLWQVLSTRVPENAANDPWQSEWQFFGTVLAIFNDIGPTTIFLENATILDEASAALTHFLLQQAQLPLLLIATCRGHADNLAWLNTFSADEYTVLNLPPLSPAAVKTCVDNLLDGAVPEDAVTFITEKSGGNPLQIEELTYQLVESNQLQQRNNVWHYTAAKTVTTPKDAFLPRAVLGAFTRQLEKLPEYNRQALAVAALVEPEPEFDFNTWLAALGGEDKRESAQAIVDDALKKRILRQIGDNADHPRYTFRPGDVAKALVAGLSQKRQKELHHQLARIIRQQKGDPILMSYHYEKAGENTDAVYQLEKAGSKAIEANAFDSAIVYYQRAIKLMESSSAYQALGYLYRLKGRADDSVNAFERALTLAQKSGNVKEQSVILNNLAHTLWLYDDYPAAEKYATAVLNLSNAPAKEQISAQSHLATITWLMGRFSESETWRKKTIAPLQQHKNKALLAQAYNGLGQVYLSQGKLVDAKASFGQALEIYQTLDNNWEQGLAIDNLGHTAIEQGDFDEAEQLFDKALSLFKTFRSNDGLLMVYTNKGRNCLYKNQPKQAISWLTKALPLALARNKRNIYVLSDIYRLMAQASLAQGKLERAKAAAQDALKLVETVGNLEYVALAQSILGQINAAQNNTAEAEELFKMSIKLFEQIEGRGGLARVQLKYAKLLGRQGKIDQAVKLEAKAKEEAQKMGLYLASS